MLRATFDFFSPPANMSESGASVELHDLYPGGVEEGDEEDEGSQIDEEQNVTNPSAKTPGASAG